MRSKTHQPFELSRSEIQGYSFRNVLAHLLMSPGGVSPAHLELDISGRALKQGVTDHDHGVFVPAAMLARDLVVGTSTAGGNLVATDLLGMVDLLRPASVVVAAGATVIEDLRGNVAFPRLTSGATASWVAENGASSESQPAFDQVLLTPKTVTGNVDISRRLILQASMDAIELVKRDLVEALGIVVDLAAITGSGASNQPRGILNTAGIGSIVGGTNGAAPSFDNVVDLEAQTANANTVPRNVGYVTNVKVRSKLQRTQMFGGTNGVPIWQRSDDGSDRLNGRPAFVTTNVPSNLTKGTSSGICSALIYGAWADLLVGIWGSGVTLMVDPFTGGTSGTVRIVAMLDVDIAVRQPTSFAAMVDALTS